MECGIINNNNLGCLLIVNKKDGFVVFKIPPQTIEELHLSKNFPVHAKKTSH